MSERAFAPPLGPLELLRRRQPSDEGKDNAVRL
jgi:hypothetical protein